MWPQKLTADECFTSSSQSFIHTYLHGNCTKNSLKIDLHIFFLSHITRIFHVHVYTSQSPEITLKHSLLFENQTENLPYEWTLNVNIFVLAYMKGQALYLKLLLLGHLKTFCKNKNYWPFMWSFYKLGKILNS
jgi:hypothetical protein